jgi:hypothetical protein
MQKWGCRDQYSTKLALDQALKLRMGLILSLRKNSRDEETNVVISWGY